MASANSIYQTISLSVIRQLFRSAGPLLPRLFSHWGLYLWGKTHRPAWRPWEITIINQSRRSSLKIAHQTIATYVWGEGSRSILLVHGWNSRASHFKNIIEQLTHHGYRVIGFDAVGHGHSSGNWASVVDYQAALKSLQEYFGPFHTVIGHSFGGFCIPYALTHGLQANNAILMAAPGNMQWLFERFTVNIQAPRSVTLAMQALIEQRFGCGFWNQYDIAHNAPQIDALPVLIVHDKNDPGVSVKHAQHHHQAWPGSELVLTHKLGHHRVLRHPSTLNSVLEFIEAN